MADESEVDFELIERSWQAEWQPEGYKEQRLVEILTHNDWLLKRGFRRAYEAVERAAGDDNLPREQWSTEAKENVDRMVQYKAQAERSFYRSLAFLEQLKKDIIRMEEKYLKVVRERDQFEQRLEKYEPKEAPEQKAKAEAKPLTPAEKLFQGQLNAKKKARRRPKVLEQWVHVSVKEGKTITALFPSNEDLIKRGQKFWPPPELVYRRLDFRNGVPKEYHWTTYDPVRRAAGGMGIQRMTTDQWLLCVEREKQNPDGHIGPTGVGNMARPHSRGGCNCESCTRPNNVKLMEEWEKSRAA